ncbi:MmgE/PrpD family protein [Actinophytocola gossypii]|uniref:MmgE/PrpD family protein n=1 Tax=Actinophytocola gossypii TaxID=2812003 RepID=A0ABT2J2H0_9PSEU|nr:MmgE/PrpD family protein [Actinophytocola gossypii]MCT2582051.1 MmgE/PrpD family protein [Actinophytocola gossypii]
MTSTATSTAERLAAWAHDLRPTDEDRALARRALLDTVAVTAAARGSRMAALTTGLSPSARWAAVGHVLDFDDLHLPSTAHISVVCVPAALATGGGADAYLAGAGVLARLGTALGWSHYARGWHVTCTAGAPAAAVTAAVALGLSAERTAHAIALAVPQAGGVQAAFGSDGKALQVGLAAEAGVRAARLAAAGATADPAALDQWLALVGDAPEVDLSGPAVPGGLAIKLFPCCYALQRPIAALREQLPKTSAEEVGRIVVRTTASSVQPLHHHRPDTGLRGKFSLEYALAAALLDDHPGFASFTDEAVRRPAARRLVELVEVVLEPGGEGLLNGEADIELTMADGSRPRARLALPPGAPQRPPTDTELAEKLAACDAADLVGLDWSGAAAFLGDLLPGEAA